MTGYGSSLYGSDWYLASPFVANTELWVGIKARIVRPVRSVPPVMDTISVGLAQRFDWLQQGIQAFALFNKIDFATGQRDGFLPSLDDVWGRIYDLPRLAGESDEDYRTRLQTYVKVLTGSGSVPNCQAVLDIVIGLPGTTRITSLWPARVLIDFTSVDAMRRARARQELINTMLPGMFAAGVDYELIIPFLDVGIKAAIQGDAQLPINIRAAIATDMELSCGIEAAVACNPELKAYILAAIQADRTLEYPIRAAIRAERILEPGILAAIQGNPELPAKIQAAIQAERELACRQKAAIQGELELPYNLRAAIARSFELPCGILARIEKMYELPCYIKAAVQKEQVLQVGIRARITRRSS